MQPDTSPLYLRDGQTIADGIDPARVIFIKRVLIEPPEREQEELPELAAEPEAEGKPPRNFDQSIRMPHGFSREDLAEFCGLFCSFAESR